MTMNSYQKQVYDNIAKATSITTAASSIQVEQTPTFLKEPMKIADFAVGTIAALGAVTAELAEARGLPSQKIAVDRRHALLTLNDGAISATVPNTVMLVVGKIRYSDAFFIFPYFQKQDLCTI
jgi:ubiquinone/menaquinone biosynthesis C-methylase UbiE